ncbi:hypothetical protein L211DRAFT_450708 [Terfezia boudieri ATCC MYA-4762]|uniref:Uncharacterized protein n=1 Tax=Terfezia boudieri ATCC MYA-4762 TaxID=1051890 RepID=A0A3N4LE65_9PEZI|nr:hypothetical protein L211DRAFT_450708 [Terfezia boudieri ATCC MYA-4762]
MGSELDRIRQNGRNMEQPSSSGSACRTPGMAGKKALVTFRIALPHNHRPQPQKIQLFGSWTSYTTSIPMERDVRAGHGIWKSGGPKGGLEQGAVYGYYYVMDGKTIYYDPAAGRTVRDDRTGRVVNVIEVPIEMPSEEDQRLREKVSIARMILEREQGKVEGGGDIRGQERSYNELDLPTTQHHQRPLPRRTKADSVLSSSAPQAPAPPPLSHQLHHHTGNYDYASSAPHRISRVENARPRSSKGDIEQESMNSLRQYLTESESAISSGGPSATVDQQHPPPKLLLRRATQATPFISSQASARRKPVPTSTAKDATPFLPPIAPRADGGVTRKPYTFLGRKISIPTLNSPIIPGKQLAVESTSLSHLEPFYSPYPPPPPPQFSSTDQATPSPIYPPESRNSEVYPIVAKKDSGSQRRRWSFLPQSAGKSKAIPIPGAAAASYAEPAAPSPRRKLGRLFSLSLKPAIHNPIVNPRAELHTGTCSVNTTYGIGSNTSVETHRMHNTPSPLDIPPPPEFVVADRHRTRPLEQELVRDGGVTGDGITRDGGVTWDGGRSRTRVDLSVGMTAQDNTSTKKTAKKNSDSPNLGGETWGAEVQAETASEAAPPEGPTTIAQLARERIYLGGSPAREIAGLGLGVGLRAGGQEGRVRGSFLQDRETRLENIMLRDEERSASGGRRLPRSVSLGGGVLRSGLLSASSSLANTRNGGGFVMVGHGIDGGDGESETGTEEESGYELSGYGRGYLRRGYEEVVSTPGTIIRLDPDEFRPRKEPEQEPSVPNNVNSDGNLERIDLGNNYGNNDYTHTTNDEDRSAYDSGSSRSSSSTETDRLHSAGELSVQTQGGEKPLESAGPPQAPSPIIKTTTLSYTSSFLDRTINTSPITIIPSRLSSYEDNRSSAKARGSPYHSSFNSYSENSLDASPREPASPISPNTSTSNSPQSTPSSPSPSYSPKTTITGNSKPLTHSLNLEFSTIDLDFEQTIKVPRFRPRKRIDLGALKGGNRDMGPYVGDILLRNQVQVGEEVVYADDDVEAEVGWNGVAIADGAEGDGGVTVESSGGGGVNLPAGEGNGGVYHGAGSGRMRYLKSLRCLRDEVQGELDGKKEIWEELGWLGRAVV